MGVLIALSACNCDDTLDALPEPQINVLDENDNSHQEADPWLVVGLGDVDNGTTATHTLRLENSNTGLLEIEAVCLVDAATAEDAISDNAPCILGSASAFTFPNIVGQAAAAGESVELPVTFSPTDGGAQALFLRISSNAEDEPVVAVQLTGRGTAGRLCADNAVLDFEEVSVGDTKTLPITLTNCGARPVSIDSFLLAQNPDDVFSVQINGADPSVPMGPLEEGEEIVLDVTFAPLQARVYRDTLAGSIELTTAAPFVGTYTLLLVGDAKTPPACRVNIVPQVVQFGAVAGGETAAQDLIVQSVGECACVVESLEGPTAVAPTADGVFTIPNPPTLPMTLRGTRGCDGDPADAETAENRLTVSVEYTSPVRDIPEADRATVTITTNDEATPSAEIQLEANGGGNPYCEFNVTPVGGGLFGQGAIGRFGVVEFGRTTVFFQKRLPITFENTGNANCEITGVEWDVAANTQANEFSLEHTDGSPVNVGATAPITVAPGQSQTYFAVFSPTRVIESDNPFDIFSFGSYSASNELCGLLGPNTRCNGVKFLTTDNRTDVGDGVTNGEFSIGFSATPVKPQIDVIPGEVEFGLVTVGCGSPEQRINVYNTGSGDLFVGQPFIDPANTPPDFEITAINTPQGINGPWPHTIPPGGSMSMFLRYRANSLGLATAQLIIPTVEDGEEGPPVSVPMRGEGTLETEQTDIFDQFSDPKTDVLWVVDDSGSMSPFQQLLADNFDQFFTASNVDSADYHIAVTTTLTVSSSCIPDFSGTNSCEADSMCGHYTACSGNDRFLDTTSSSPDSQFSCNVRVSDSGNVNPSRDSSDSAEGALQAARFFLDGENVAPGGPNEGFLRDDAKLHVIMVSDEPDQSQGPVDLYVDFFRNLKGFRNDSLVAVSAIAAPSSGCTAPDGTAIGGDARYETAVDELNGRFQSICASDWTSMMANLGLDSLGLKVEFFLSRAADAATLSVCVAERSGGVLGACNPQAQTSDGAATGYFYDPASNSIVFNPGSVPPRGSQVQVHYETYCYSLD